MIRVQLDTFQERLKSSSTHSTIMSIHSKGEYQHSDREVHLHDYPKAVEATTPEYVEGTAEEKKLVRKIDMHLIPILWIMYVFNYLDRTNIGVSGAITAA